MIGIIVDGDIYAGPGIEPATPGYRAGSGGPLIYTFAYLDWFLVWMILIFYVCIILFRRSRVTLKEAYYVLKMYIIHMWGFPLFLLTVFMYLCFPVQ